MDNVAIHVYRRGVLADSRFGHNVWTSRGREYLAELLAYTSFTPQTAERSDRIRYMGLGIGGVTQGVYLSTLAAPLSTSYPPGFDPNTSAGNEYDSRNPIVPLVTTLERPVRVSGGENPYATAPGTDVWLVDHPKFFVTRPTAYSLMFHGKVVPADGDMIYGSFTSMPLSEVGLFSDEAAVDINDAYNPLMAYYTFNTIQLTADVVLEVLWTVEF